MNISKERETERSLHLESTGTDLARFRVTLEIYFPLSLPADFSCTLLPSLVYFLLHLYPWGLETFGELLWGKQRQVCKFSLHQSWLDKCILIDLQLKSQGESNLGYQSCLSTGCTLRLQCPPLVQKREGWSPLILPFKDSFQQTLSGC